MWSCEHFQELFLSKNTLKLVFHLLSVRISQNFGVKFYIWRNFPSQDYFTQICGYFQYDVCQTYYKRYPVPIFDTILKSKLNKRAHISYKLGSGSRDGWIMAQHTLIKGNKRVADSVTLGLRNNFGLCYQ